MNDGNDVIDNNPNIRANGFRPAGDDPDSGNHGRDRLNNTVYFRGSLRAIGNARLIVREIGELLEASKKNGTTLKSVSKKTGVAQNTLTRFTHESTGTTLDTAEIILEAIGYRLKIVRVGKMNDENSIEFLTGQKTATITATAMKLKNRLKKLSEDHPEEVNLVENEDGSLCVHLPLSYIKISAPRAMSEEAKAKGAERLAAYRSQNV